ncbi:hypothetical protein [Paremcibacter congregatus]
MIAFDGWMEMNFPEAVQHKKKRQSFKAFRDSVVKAMGGVK